jgi:hypothetical protein
MIIVGLGIGPTMPVFTLAAQNAVSMSQLGVVTSLTQFARSIGSTLGVALFGSLLSNGFVPAFRAALPPAIVSSLPPELLARFENPQVLLSPEVASALRQQVLGLGPQGAQIFDALFAAIRIGLVSALHHVFLLGALLGTCGIVFVLFLKELPLRKTYAPAMAAEPMSETAAQVGRDAFPSLPPLRPSDQPAMPRPVATADGTPAADGTRVS